MELLIRDAVPGLYLVRLRADGSMTHIDMPYTAREEAMTDTEFMANMILPSLESLRDYEAARAIQKGSQGPTSAEFIEASAIRKGVRLDG